MGDTLAFFQLLENIPSAKDELKIILRNGATTIAVSFKSLPDILFNPRALLDLIFDISLRIIINNSEEEFAIYVLDSLNNSNEY